jgi:hypothetical protein
MSLADAEEKHGGEKNGACRDHRMEQRIELMNC